MQAVLYFNLEADPLLIGAISLPVSFLIAALSWSFIEKPSLRLKGRAGEGLRAMFGRKTKRLSSADP